MLGQPVLTVYNRKEDFRSPADYLAYMFCGKGGYFSRCLIRKEFYESGWKSDSMIKDSLWNNKRDCYISMNSFLTTKQKETPLSGRCTENLKRLNALYVDIDCYKLKMTQEAVLFNLELFYFDKTMPCPTFVIDSGRGLYLIWKIDEDRKALPRWQSVENYLIDQCEEVGSDAKAKDPARILRVPGTVNSKNGRKVSILRYQNVQYTLNELIREYDIKPQKTQRRRTRPDGLPSYPYGHATEKQRKTARWIATDLQIDLPDFTSFNETAKYIEKYLPLASENYKNKTKQDKPVNLIKHTSLKSMIAGYIEDVRRLMVNRKGENCCREFALFLTRNWWLELTKDPAYAKEQAQILNSLLDRPFTEEYVSKATESAEKKFKTGHTYHYSRKAIIKALEITEAEQREMKYLCGYPVSEKERRSRANHRAYLSRLEKEGRDTKKTEIQERRENIAAMLAEGKGKADICHALNLSSRTFDRDKAVIVAEGLIEKAKAAMEAVKKAVESVAEKVEEAATCAVSGGSDTVRECSPFFKSSYYKAKGVALLPNPLDSAKYIEGDCALLPGWPSGP